MLQRFLNESMDSSATVKDSSTFLSLKKVDFKLPKKMPRPLRSSPIHRTPNRSTNLSRLDVQTIITLDFLKQFRHDLIGTTKSVSLLFKQFNSESRLRTHIDSYFEYLADVFKKQPKVNYLDLINYSVYPYDDWLAYGSRFEEFICKSSCFFQSRKKKLYSDVMKQYVKIHPRGIIMVRKKLLDLLMKPLGIGNAHELEITYQMISYTAVDEYNLFQRISLMPDAKSQVDHIIKFISMPSSTRNSFDRIFLAINTAIQSSPISVFRPKLYIFGSIASDLATYDSDLDLIVKLEAPTKDVESYDFETSILALEAIDRVLSEKLNLSSLDAGKRLNPARRCPTLKYDFSAVFAHLSPETFGNNLTSQRRYSSAEISVKSYYGVFTSKMIHLLTQCEPRFRKLAIILKHWAKRQGLIREKGFKSYGFTLLVVFFLQSTKPPVLPKISLLKKLTAQLKNEHEKEVVDFSEYFEVIDVNKNRQFVISLLVDFFKFYAKFNYDYAVCPRLGQTISKAELLATKTEAEKVGFSPNSVIWIEDPLAVGNNVASLWPMSACLNFIQMMKKIVDADINENNIITKLYSNLFEATPSNIQNLPVEKPLSSEKTGIMSFTFPQPLPSTCKSAGLKRKAADEHLNSDKKLAVKDENDSEIEFLGVFKGLKH